MMMTLNWSTEKGLILKRVQSQLGMFKVHNFFQSCKDLPKSNQDFVSRFSQLSLELIHYDQLEFNVKVKAGKKMAMKRHFDTVENYYRNSVSDPKYFSTIKCYEDLIPEPLINDLSSCLDTNTIKDSCQASNLPNFYYRFFYGLKGHHTDAHIDWSAYNSVLLQIYGDKEMILVSPKFLHLIPFVYNYVDAYPSSFEDFLVKKNIPHLKVLIKAGEGLYIPPYYAHSVRYLTDTCSLSLRLLPHRQLESLHRRLPCNTTLANLFHERFSSHQIDEQFINQLMNASNYQELLSFYHEDFKRIHGRETPRNPASEAYEEFLFQERKGIDHHLNEKKRRLSIAQRGCAHFEQL